MRIYIWAGSNLKNLISYSETIIFQLKLVWYYQTIIKLMVLNIKKIQHTIHLYKYKNKKL